MHTVEPHELNDLFATVANIYKESSDGEKLIYWLRKDWGVFQISDSFGEDDSKTEGLLAAIFRDDEDVVEKKYHPSSGYGSGILKTWNDLSDELRNRNRYFLDVELDSSRLDELLELLQAKDVPRKWYRARINEEGGVFPMEKMGAPPGEVASHGRENPPGIPYLYIGSTVETSIAEIRPHTGEIANVAEFMIDSDKLKIVDLRKPKETISPFALGDEDKIGALRSDIGFLERLGDELTRPVRPKLVPIEYVPSQYLCEFIKSSGWDGVLYRSSVSDGFNLALFDQGKAKIKNVQKCSVEKVSVSTSEMTS